ncbi:MAG: tRNA 2-selenouridine(34) synthase MnmH [Gammaproteobacteria bacterium]|nr:MAG: tRNA 2-selenouridine(34) synthase MnmH [Gammaproteobacteria bacterium]
MPLIPPAEFDRLLIDGTALLDLRAPQEFSRGAFPAATNLPLLDDDERHQVGLRYKQAGPDAAVTLGHKLVSGDVRAARLAAWCAWADAHPDGVIYCWRGGQRSAIVQDWLAAVGRLRPRIEGGYKALRQHLLTATERIAPALPLLVLGGRTGTGKTRMLAAIACSLDLEGLAHHRGSAFGGRPGGQPPPAGFENALAIRLLQLEATGAGPVVVEDESRNIGRLSLPEALSANLARSPLVLVERSLEERVQITLEDYIEAGLAERQVAHGEGGFAVFAHWLRDAMHRIRKRLGGVRHREITALLEDALRLQADSGDPSGHRAWIERLLADYYDPMYDYQLRQKADRIVFRGSAEAVAAFLADGAAAAEGRRLQR